MHTSQPPMKGRQARLEFHMATRASFYSGAWFLFQRAVSPFVWYLEGNFYLFCLVASFLLSTENDEERFAWVSECHSLCHNNAAAQRR